MRLDDLREGERYHRPAYTVPAEDVTVLEVQPAMVRIEHEDGTIGAIPKRVFIAQYSPKDQS